jgi:hypothetical protein
MTVNAINTNDNKRKNASYLKAITIGGASGYVLKHILPITPQEKDERYSLFLHDLKRQTRDAKLKEIGAIRNSQTRTLAEDAFISLIDKKEITVSKVREIPEPTASSVLKIIAQVNEHGRIAKETAKEVFTAVTKHIRPTTTFLGMGAGVAVATAFVYNTLGRFSEK